MHTPLPWKVWENPMRDDGVFIGPDVEPKPYENGTKDIEGNPRMQLPPMITHSQIDREDGELAVACVNACKGINPEAVPEMLKVFKMAIESWAKHGAIATGFNNPLRKKIEAVVAKAEKTNG